jgi:hypothetical protein
MARLDRRTDEDHRSVVAQGGDWGAVIVDQMGLQTPPELLGIHTNMPGIFAVEVDQAAFSGAPAPSGLSADEKVAYERLQFEYQKGIAYGYQAGLRPQTLYGIVDSPVGLAAYFLDYDARTYEPISRVFAEESAGLTRDDILDNITIAWLTNTALSGARLYWENCGKLGFFNAKGVLDPGCRECLPGRALSCSAELGGGAGISQTGPLQQSRKRRPLGGLETAAALCRRGSRGLQTVALATRSGGAYRYAPPPRCTPATLNRCRKSSRNGDAFK